MPFDQKAYMKKYWHDNKDKLREQKRVYTATHKEQRKAYLARTRDRQIEVQRKRSLKRYYGLSLDDYDVLLLKQRGCCAICGLKSELNRYGRLYVDHSHRTGKNRALLCSHCNVGLGSFKDNVKIVVSALSYLIEHGEAVGKTVTYREAEAIRGTSERIKQLLSQQGE